MLNRSFYGPMLAGPLILATAIPASAHVARGEAHDLVHGFMHPIGALDHMLAMVAVGMLAALLGRRALWMVPTSFMVVMTIGAALAIAHLQLPFVELGISLSVIALGVAVAMQLPLPTAAAMAFVAVFAVFHGAAHGAEMPTDATGAIYAAGFLAATGLLHIVGIGLGISLNHLAPMRDAISRVAGGAIAIAGVFLAASV